MEDEDETYHELERLTTFLEGMHSLLERVNAWRAACLNHGYSPAAAETMAVQYHWLLIEQMNRSMAETSAVTHEALRFLREKKKEQ